MLGNPKLSALYHWLVSGAPGVTDFAIVTAETGRRLRAAKLPVDQFGVYKTMLNPELPGRYDYWTEAAGPRIVQLDPDELSRGQRWIGTPAQVCSASGRTLIYTTNTDPRFDTRPDMRKLARRGYCQTVCLPLHSNYTPAINVASFLTKQSGGFTAEQIACLRELQAPMARVAESYVLHESTVGVLSTYVGREAGAQVLTGNILRGHTEDIPSVLLFTDIKGFSELSNRLPPEQTIDLLNRFFSELDKSVRRNGGEILKFIGDGALAIFPTPDDHAAQVAAINGALAALDEIRADLRDTGPDGLSIPFRAAIHLGDVHYGNIGSANRMDFTVIGPTVNLTARLLTAAARLKQRTVCSAEAAALVDRPAEDLGTHAFKGFDSPVQVYGLEREISGSAAARSEDQEKNVLRAAAPYR